MKTFQSGQAVVLQAWFRDRAQALFGPDEITNIEIVLPNGDILETITTGIARISVGYYECKYILPDYK